MSSDADVKTFFDAAMPAITEAARTIAVGLLTHRGPPRDSASALLLAATNLAAARFIEAEVRRLCAMSPDDPFSAGVELAATTALAALNASFADFRSKLGHA